MHLFHMEIAYNNKIVFDFNTNWYMITETFIWYTLILYVVYITDLLKLFQNRK